jgi:hypothetical protein
MRDSIRKFSIGIAGTTLAIAFGLVVSYVFSDGKCQVYLCLSGIELVFAVVVLALGNLPVLVLNGIYWRRYGAPRWLRNVVVLQSLFALGCLFYVGKIVFYERPPSGLPAPLYEHPPPPAHVDGQPPDPPTL